MFFYVFSWFSWICSRICLPSQQFGDDFGSKKLKKSCFFGLKINKTSLNHPELHRKTLWTTTDTHKVSYYAITWKFDEMGAYFVIFFDIFRVISKISHMFDPKKLKPKNPKIEKIANFGRKTSQLSFASIFSPIGPKLGEIEANYWKKRCASAGGVHV